MEGRLGVVDGLDRKWWTLIAVCTAIFMLLLDITVVNVALPDMQRDLDASFAQLQWVVDAYALTLATTVLAAGSLADLLGRRRVFTLGLVLFTVASFAAGSRPTRAPDRRAGRSGRGRRHHVRRLAGAPRECISRPRPRYGIRDLGRDDGCGCRDRPARRRRAHGVGRLALDLLRQHPDRGCGDLRDDVAGDESKNPNAGRVDWLGTAALTGSLFLLVYGLLAGKREGLDERAHPRLPDRRGRPARGVRGDRAAATRPDARPPPVPKPGFDGAQIAAFAISSSIFAAFLYLTLYLQNVLGYSPLQAGLRFLPLSLAAFVVAADLGQSHVPRLGALADGRRPRDHRRLAAPDVARRHDSGWTLLLAGFLSAVGIGLTNPALASTAVSVVSPERAGMASGTNSTFRQVGIATGIAGLGALFQRTISSKLAPRWRLRRATTSSPRWRRAPSRRTSRRRHGPRSSNRSARSSRRRDRRARGSGAGRGAPARHAPSAGAGARRR